MMSEQRLRILSELGEFLISFKGECVTLSERIRWGDVQASREQMPICIESIQWICEAFDSIQTVYPRSSFAQAWAPLRAEIYKQLSDVLKSLEAGDLVTLADFVEFEVTYWVDKWLEILNIPDTLKALEV